MSNNFNTMVDIAISELSKTIDKSAAQTALDSNIPIYYADYDTPQGLLIKEYPDGRRQLVNFSRKDDEVINEL